ncbi:Receptor expression-enhancing protein 4 [Nymphon striatum]|nr:Receptor expression-enhancing protein 4 [Nymphon striatum]
MVKWMMYWIVYALFTCIETFADIFASFWLPFYYELKILFVLWLISPYTEGSSFLYRKFIHPKLDKHEQEIDEYILQFREKGYEKLLALGNKGISMASNVVLQTALKVILKLRCSFEVVASDIEEVYTGQETIVKQITKSYSMNDLSQSNLNNKAISHMPYIADEVDEQSAQLDNRLPDNARARRRALRGRKSLSYREMSDSGDEDLSTSSLSEKTTRRRAKKNGMTLRNRDLHSGGGYGVDNSNKKSVYDDVSAYATLSKATSKRMKKKPPPS